MVQVLPHQRTVLSFDRPSHSHEDIFLQIPLPRAVYVSAPVGLDLSFGTRSGFVHLADGVVRPVDRRQREEGNLQAQIQQSKVNNKPNNHTDDRVFLHRDGVWGCGKWDRVFYQHRSTSVFVSDGQYRAGCVYRLAVEEEWEVDARK